MKHVFCSEKSYEFIRNGTNQGTFLVSLLGGPGERLGGRKLKQQIRMAQQIGIHDQMTVQTAHTNVTIGNQILSEFEYHLRVTVITGEISYDIPDDPRISIAAGGGGSNDSSGRISQFRKGMLSFSLHLFWPRGV